MVKGVASACSQNNGSSPNKEKLTLSPITWCFSLIHLPFYFACLHVHLCSHQFRKSVCLLDVASPLTVSVLIFVAFAEIIEFFVVYFICANAWVDVSSRRNKWKDRKTNIISPASARQRNFTRWRLLRSTFNHSMREPKVENNNVGSEKLMREDLSAFFCMCGNCKQHTLLRRIYWQLTYYIFKRYARLMKSQNENVRLNCDAQWETVEDEHTCWKKFDALLHLWLYGASHSRYRMNGKDPPGTISSPAPKMRFTYIHSLFIVHFHKEFPSPLLKWHTHIHLLAARANVIGKAINRLTETSKWSVDGNYFAVSDSLQQTKGKAFSRWKHTRFNCMRAYIKYLKPEGVYSSVSTNVSAAAESNLPRIYSIFTFFWRFNKN